MCICACVCVSLCELKHDVKGSHEEVQNRSYRLERSQVWLEKSCFIIPFTFAWRSVGALVSSPSHDPVVSESGVCACVRAFTSSLAPSEDRGTISPSLCRRDKRECREEQAVEQAARLLHAHQTAHADLQGDDLSNLGKTTRYQRKIMTPRINRLIHLWLSICPPLRGRISIPCCISL